MIFCKHSWEVISSHLTESTFEHAMKVATSAGKQTSVKIPWQLSDGTRHLIETFQCKKCGKIKRFETKI